MLLATFGRNGPYADAWTVHPQSTTASGVTIPDQSLIFTCLQVFSFFVSYPLSSLTEVSVI